MSETKPTPLAVPRRISGPFVVDTSSLCHGVDRVSRVAVRDQTPAQNLLGFVDPEWAGIVVQAINAHERLEADSKKLREPATCNAGHKSNLPLALWDCPVCTQLLRDELDRLRPKVEELVRELIDTLTLKPNEYLTKSCVQELLGKAREVEAALKGKAE